MSWNVWGMDSTVILLQSLVKVCAEILARLSFPQVFFMRKIGGECVLSVSQFAHGIIRSSDVGWKLWKYGDEVKFNLIKLDKRNKILYYITDFSYENSCLSHVFRNISSLDENKIILKLILTFLLNFYRLYTERKILFFLLKRRKEEIVLHTERKILFFLLKRRKEK